MEIMTIGDCIKKLREAKGFTQQDLAEKASVTVTTVSRIENGSNPSRAILKCLADALGCTPEKLKEIK